MNEEKMNRATERVLSYLDDHQHDMVALLQEMLRIPSVNPPGNEGPMATLVIDELEQLGFEIEVVEVEEGRPNVIATLRGSRGSPSLVCYAHFDVVPPGDRTQWRHDPFGGVIEDGNVYGRGAVDHKSPIAALIAAVRAILASGISMVGDLIFTFVVDEESMGYKGMRHIAEHRMVRADYGLYCTHTGVASDMSRQSSMPWMQRDNVIIAHNGKMWVRVTIEGQTTHTMTLESGNNAIEKAGLAIAALTNLSKEVSRRQHPLTGRSRMSMNMIRGGSKDNMLPDRCEIDIDRRYTPSEDPTTVFREIEEVVRRLEEQDKDFTASVEIVTDDPASEIPPDHPIVRVTCRASEAITGRAPHVTGVSATADSRWFIRNLNIPMAMFGLGDLFQAHRANEHISIQDLTDTSKAYALIILDLLHTGNED